MKVPLVVLAIAAFTLTACGDPGTVAADDSYPTRLVLSDDHSGSGFHPATGYGQAGVSPLFDGLLRPVPTGQGQLPNFAPALAAELPVPNADATEWTVRLKENIGFTDGTALDAADVVASYRTAKDISAGSEVASTYEAIASIDAIDERTVVFRLAFPLGDISSRLLYPITPSEKQGIEEQNTHPVGTGAFEFSIRRGDDTVFTANPNYWGGQVPIKELVITATSDDSARAQRVLAGDFSGAVIPALQASKYVGNEKVRMDVATGADWRAISLPATPELRDPRVRRALNLGTNRQALIDGPFAGYGSPAATPIARYFGSLHNPEATFTHDVAAANALLDEAGLPRGAEGIRFSMPLYYPGTDSGRRDLAVEFAGQMRELGIAVEPKAGTWDEITPRMSEAAVVLGGGEVPYDVDMVAFDQMHTRGDATSPYSNPGNYGSAELDQILIQARGSLDPDARAKLWHQAQESYVANPSLVMIGTVDHVYLSRPNAWVKPEPMLEPHIHGATWGPWWNVTQWRK